MCMFLCSDDPLENDDSKYGKYHAFVNQWQVGMIHAPGADPLVCCAACVCVPCAQYYLRDKVLGGQMENYICCQGYYPACCCFRPGHMGEQQCPHLCLALESIFCQSCAVSSSRLAVMDMYELQSDPMDRRIIRFNNCIQMAACICDIIAIFMAQARDLAHILNLIAEIVWYSTQACMTTQTNFELNYRTKTLLGGADDAATVENPIAVAVPADGGPVSSEDMER